MSAIAEITDTSQTTSRVVELTLLELVSAISGLTDSEEQTLEILFGLLRSGRIRLTGSFLGNHVQGLDRFRSRNRASGTRRALSRSAN
jgi:hypothetical protein